MVLMKLDIYYFIYDMLLTFLLDKVLQNPENHLILFRRAQFRTFADNSQKARSSLIFKNREILGFLLFTENLNYALLNCKSISKSVKFYD